MPTLANRFSFRSYHFVSRIKSKKAIECFKKQKFHIALTDLIATTESYDGTVTAMGLLACLMYKYRDHLKDVKPLLKSQIPNVLLEKVRKYGNMPQSKFGNNFRRIMLNLTADKQLSLELYNRGYMDQLVGHIHENYIPTVKQTLIDAIGNIALGGSHIKQILLDQQVYIPMLTILQEQVENDDPYHLSASCRMLEILASSDWAKRKFFEHGCVDLLGKLMKQRKDNAELCWWALELLSSIGWVSSINRRYILTQDVIETVIVILKECTDEKVISSTFFVFLLSGELDEGSTRLKELGVEELLRKAIENPKYKKEGSNIEKLGTRVLEQQALYTIFVPQQTISLPPPSSPFTIDWPPQPENSPLVDEEEAFSSSPNSLVHSKNLLPLEDKYLKPHTPIASMLSEATKEQLAKLGINPNKPLFRVGRMYGSNYGSCRNCQKNGISEELVIRPQSMTPFQYQLLINNGWYRRGGVTMFRLRCNHNVHCCNWETRVSVRDFDYRTHKSYKKVLRKMPTDRLTVETKPTHFDRDAFNLYNEYHATRYGHLPSSEYSYCEHIVNTPIANQTVDGIDYGTYHQLYKLDGKLVAVGVIDIVPTGIVSVYMWYSVSKEVMKLSFGIYSMLKEIEFVRELSKHNPRMKYYYLQGWNDKNKKLSYKANYSPEEFYCPCIVQGWVQDLAQVDSSRTEYIRKKLGEGARPLMLDESKGSSVNPSDNMPRNSNDTSKKNQGMKREEDSKEEDSSEHHGKESQGVSLKNTEKSKDKNEEDKNEEDENEEDENEEDKNKDKNEEDKNEEDKSEEDKNASESVVYCEAFPIDKVRYQQQTGKSVVDVSKIVVCLNYSEYMYLGELFQQFQLCAEQKSMMEQRFAELLVALGPELRSQLVVDLKACPNSEVGLSPESM